MAETAETKTAVFNIIGQYAKDISFECPVPAFAKEAADLKISMDVQLGSRPLADKAHETVLRLKVEAKNKEEVTCFLTEVEYAGVYHVEGVEGDHLTALLQIDGAAIIYPFARQLVMGLIADAGYRAPQLAPMNFHAMHMEAQKRQKEASEAKAS